MYYLTQSKAVKVVVVYKKGTYKKAYKKGQSIHIRFDIQTSMRTGNPFGRLFDTVTVCAATRLDLVNISLGVLNY